jgi:putative Holliday junction resolvase
LSTKEQVNNESRVMGIDFGEKRIGIALSDPLFTFAYPYTTLQNDSDLLKNLSVIIREKSINKIILGLPTNRFKSSEKLSIKVQKLKASLESLIKIEVILWDEDYSSIIAQEKIIESVVKKSKRKEKALLDKHSAAIILQEYLDSK